MVCLGSSFLQSLPPAVAPADSTHRPAIPFVGHCVISPQMLVERPGAQVCGSSASGVLGRSQAGKARTSKILGRNERCD